MADIMQDPMKSPSPSLVRQADQQWRLTTQHLTTRLIDLIVREARLSLSFDLLQQALESNDYCHTACAFLWPPGIRPDARPA